MNKAQLVDFVANRTGLTKKDVNSSLDAMVEAVISTVSKRDVVTLTGFGTFMPAKRKATEKRNPRSGEKVKVAEKFVPKFKPGKSFKEAVAKK